MVKSMRCRGLVSLPMREGVFGWHPRRRQCAQLQHRACSNDSTLVISEGSKHRSVHIHLDSSRCCCTTPGPCSPHHRSPSRSALVGLSPRSWPCMQRQGRRVVFWGLNIGCRVSRGIPRREEPSSSITAGRTSYLTPPAPTQCLQTPTSILSHVPCSFHAHHMRG